ncbi:MAG: DUF1647 domain-containing protein [Cyclobacteriaceae bacterium]
MADQNNYIISAGDKNFYRCFTQLMYSYVRHKEFRNSKIIFFDLGLTDEQLHKLDVKMEEVDWLEVRKFDFSLYPKHFEPGQMNYAWKPTLIHEVFEEKKGNILYLDSANLILKNLRPVWEELERFGTYAPLCGTGSLKEWTLQQTLDYLEVSDELAENRNRAGNTVGFSYHFDEVQNLVRRWKDLAAIEECIHPKGATRHNHKSDQSILTILLLKAEISDQLKLTKEEVDISSSHPVKFISVRKKISDSMILPVGPFSYFYFLIKRRIDILVNKFAGN